jgi:lysophospholipase
VLYLPNSPWSGYSNFSFFQSAFTPNQVDATLDNAFPLATYGNGSVDTEWPACLACAAIAGSMRGLGMSMPPACEVCFRRHCWNGTTGAADGVGPQDFNLKPRLNESLSFEEWNSTVWTAGAKNSSSSKGGSGGGGSGGSGGSASADSSNSASEDTGDEGGAGSLQVADGLAAAMASVVLLFFAFL